MKACNFDVQMADNAFVIIDKNHNRKLERNQVTVLVNSCLAKVGGSLKNEAKVELLQNKALEWYNYYKINFMLYFWSYYMQSHQNLIL